MIAGTLGYGWTSNVTAHLHHATYIFSAPNDLLIKNGDGSFDLRYQAGRTVYRFSATGDLTSIVDEFGRATTLTYDAQDRLQQVADGSGTGRFINVFWGANGRVSSLQDQASRTVQYGYDTQGKLLTVTDPAGRVTTYSYVAGKFSPLLSQVQDHWNRVLGERRPGQQGRLAGEHLGLPAPGRELPPDRSDEPDRGRHRPHGLQRRRDHPTANRRGRIRRPTRTSPLATRRTTWPP